VRTSFGSSPDASIIPPTPHADQCRSSNH
jgi:hypothetical protein